MVSFLKLELSNSDTLSGQQASRITLFLPPQNCNYRNTPMPRCLGGYLRSKLGSLCLLICTSLAGPLSQTHQCILKNMQSSQPEISACRFYSWTLHCGSAYTFLCMFITAPTLFPGYTSQVGVKLKASFFLETQLYHFSKKWDLRK